jgi:crotonobetainyl-CoA:carnitine CoA-transferase CaiB-like acyl-CoA transferase
MAGVVGLTGEREGVPGKAGISYVDHTGGLAAALAVTSGLAGSARTGRGRHVDVDLFDVQMSMLTYLASWHLNRPPAGPAAPDGDHNAGDVGSRPRGAFGRDASARSVTRPIASPS